MISGILQLRRLQKNLRLPEEELREIQRQKLKKLLAHAYQNVPYYRNLFDEAGIRPEDIQEIEDLQKLPVTTKETLKETPIDQLIAKNIKKENCIVERTSGSTGTPLAVYDDLKGLNFKRAIFLRLLYENGYKPWHKIVEIRIENKKKFWFQKLGIMDREYISTQLPLEGQVEFLLKYQPEVIYSVKSSLEALGHFIIQHNVQFPKPRLVVSGGEVLDAESRDIMKRAFGINPVNIYGMVEIGNIAWDCPNHDGLHTNIDCCVVEFIKDGRPAKPGEEGRTICTSLHAYVMPFIRYELGDLCVPSSRTCSCGRQLPLIEKISGRVEDGIVLRDGQMIFWPFFYELMKNYSSVKQYRIIQEQLDQIKILLAMKELDYSQVVERLEQELRETFPKEVILSFERVETLSPDRSGKIRSVVSFVHKPHGQA
jgi:phenylacetate-CoA ligase